MKALNFYLLYMAFLGSYNKLNVLGLIISPNNNNNNNNDNGNNNNNNKNINDYKSTSDTQINAGDGYHQESSESLLKTEMKKYDEQNPQKESSQEFSKRDPVGGLERALETIRLNKTPLPPWLKTITGLNDWPGLEPPYIPLDFIDFSKIPQIEQYGPSQCTIVPRDSCSFDCYKCVEPDDVYTCHKLSQTFDDGPSDSTEELLKHLGDTKSTFFNLGINIVSHPNVYKKIIEQGHLIGTHTWSHPFLPSLTNEQIIAQIEWSIWAMNATGNHIPKWFRPPYGGIDNRVRSITRQFGLQAVLWDHDTFDWELLNGNSQRTENAIFEDVKKRKADSASKGGLILEHDGASKTVEVGKKVFDIVGKDQLTVAKCIGGIDYIRKYSDLEKKL
ncbi:uncharacterized protein SCDLUD_001430 [Saccharomycodes ludwigii]|uniref:uncharacterized protein n=1 Tax=Saccharomycodes ludwigii TaxID=36035 RepID=UPI001E87BBAB|nr:hypothetical protein SCDLUD_001430 [Saccharomycodes ludwigii]KAH3901661.1 hypothetical protein SCDLUD_001430 [Saccharomycodes ludwigii]